MSRSITKKIVVEAKLIAQTPLSIGGIDTKGGVDLTLAKNGADEYYVPGTSVAGPIRHWFLKHLKDAENSVAEMLGYQNHDEGHASFLIVEDAKIELPLGLGEEIRDGIGIDPRTGTTAKGLKYNRAVLPKGSVIPLKLELDIASENGANFEGAMAALLTEMQGSAFRIGAAKTRGLGKVTLEEESLRVKVFDFSNKSDLLAWITDGNPEASGGLDKLTPDAGILETPDKLFITIHWKPASPIMVKAGYDGKDADMLPLVSGGKDGTLSPVIPGSSIKGIIRAHATKIARTLVSDLPETSNDIKNSIINDLFGENDFIGRVAIDDIYEETEHVPDNWFTENDTEMGRSTIYQDHVAIDRFTGGASDGALYNLRAVKRESKWQPIEMEIDFCREVKDGEKWRELSAQEQQAEAALLLLVVRDMVDGLIPLGFGTRRGLGEIEVSGVSIKGTLAGEAFCLDWPTGEENKTLFDKLGEDRIESLQSAWNQMIEQGMKLVTEENNTQEMAGE